MEPRISYGKVAPGAYKAMIGLETYANNCGLERSLLNLVRLSASQINGCAYCIDMHSKDLRAEGGFPSLMVERQGRDVLAVSLISALTMSSVE